MAAGTRLSNASAEALLSLSSSAFAGAFGLLHIALYLKKGDEVEESHNHPVSGAPDISFGLSRPAFEETLQNGYLERPLGGLPELEGVSLLATRLGDQDAPFVLAVWAKDAQGGGRFAQAVGLMADRFLEPWNPAPTPAVGTQQIEVDQSLTDTGEMELVIENLKEEPATQTAKLPRHPIFEHVADFLAHPEAAFLCFNKLGKVVPLYPNNFHPYFGKVSEETDALALILKEWTPFNRDSASFAKSEPDIAMLRDLMETVFLRITDLDVLMEMLPNELHRGDTVLKLSYRYLQAQNMEDDLILILITDLTNLHSMEAKLLEERETKDMVVKIAMDLEGYKQYRKTAEEILRSIMVELEKPFDEIRGESILGSAKTLQSGAEIFEIKKLAQLTEDFEHSAKAALNNPHGIGTDDIARLMMQASAVRDGFDELQIDYLDSLISEKNLVEHTYFKVSETRLKRVEAEIGEQLIEVTLAQLEEVFDKNYRPFTKLPQLGDLALQRLERIKSFIWHEVNTKAHANLHHFFEELKMQPIGNMLKKYGIIAENLARKQSKQLVLEIRGTDIEVPMSKMQGLFSALIHLVRNSVDHGIEKMEERVFLGKDLEGHMLIAASLKGNSLQLRFEDDGRGMDPEMVRADAIGRGVVSPEEADSLNSEELIDLIFAHAANGRGQRGVGLETVCVRVKELGGQIHIRSQMEKGTSVEITLPLNP